MEQSKRPALVLLARILAEERVPYAIIGGVAVQVHHPDPRTTVDIDVAIVDRSSIPADRLAAEGFVRGGIVAHSENWTGPEQTPVQFSDDPALAAAIPRAVSIDLEGIELRVMGRVDLLREKLRAGSDPARRRSKRLQDLADAHALLEVDPALEQDLTPKERRALGELPT